MCSCCRNRCRSASLKLGDAVVAFSRRDVLMLRDQIAASGHPVSVIYGALPPEVRRREAERFAQRRIAHPGGHRRHRHGPEPADPPRAVQHDDEVRRRSRPHAERIGSAPDRRPRRPLRHPRGRLRRRARHRRQRQRCGNAEGTAATRRRARRATSRRRWRRTAGMSKTISSRLHKTKLREVLGVFVEQLKLDDAHFAVAELDQMLELADAARPERRPS